MIPGVIASMQPAAGGGLTLLVDDNFVGTNNLLTTHTPDVDVIGGGWFGYEEISHTCATQGFVYKPGSNDKYNGPVIETGVADGEITLTIITAADTSYRGVTFRNTNTTTFLASNLCRANNTILALLEGATQRAAVTGQNFVSSGAEHDMVVTFTGGSVTATLGGQQISYGSYATNLTTTQHGFFVEDAYGGTHDAVHRIQIMG